MRVLAHQAEGQLVGDRLAHQVRAGAEQLLDAARRAVGGFMRARPVGIAAAGHPALDVEQVLGGERHPRQRPRRGAGHGEASLRDEAAERVGGGGVGRRHAHPFLADRQNYPFPPAQASAAVHHLRF
jgi:hypothetical protein